MLPIIPLSIICLLKDLIIKLKKSINTLLFTAYLRTCSYKVPTYLFEIQGRHLAASTNHRMFCAKIQYGGQVAAYSIRPFNIVTTL